MKCGEGSNGGGGIPPLDEPFRSQMEYIVIIAVWSEMRRGFDSEKGERFCG